MKRLLPLLLLLLIPRLAFSQIIVVPSGGIATIDVSTCPPTGDCAFKVLLRANVTIAITNARGLVNLLLQEDAVGGWTVTWPSTVISPPSVTTTANTTTLVSIQFDSTTGLWYVTSGSGGGGVSFPLTSPTANPASSGSIRLASIDQQCWRNFINSGDICFVKNSSDVLQWAAGFAASPFVTLSNNPAASGEVRLSNNESQCWRNAANNADLCFTVTAGNLFQFNGATVLTSVCTAAQGCTGVASPTAHADPQAEGASVFNFIGGSALTGQVKTATNGADPSYKSPGLPGTDVNSASYTVQCDSATATVDRATTLRFITTTPTVTVPDPTASGCGSNFSFVMVASGVTVTVNRTTTAVFNIYGRSGDPTLAATTFNLTTGQYATVSSPDNTNWLVRIVPAAAAGAGVGTLYSVGAAQSTIATASPQFFPINGANSGGAGEGNVASVIGGTGCTAKNAYVVTSNTNGAAALTITLRNAATLAGMANTAIVVTVGSGAAAGTFNDTTHTVSISAGTVLSWNATMGGAGLTSAQIVGIGFQCN